MAIVNARILDQNPDFVPNCHSSSIAKCNGFQGYETSAQVQIRRQISASSQMEKGVVKPGHRRSQNWPFNQVEQLIFSTNSSYK